MPSHSHLLVIFGCRKYQATRMRWQSETWPQRLPGGIRYLQMTGDGDGKIDANGVLRLDVSDKYDHLIDKTQALFDWFLQERSERWLVKCDDDVWLSPAALNKIMSNPYSYAGAYTHGSEESPAYAGGPLYLLHRSAVAKLGRLRDYTDNRPGYRRPPEDKAVGAAAAAANIHLGSLDLDHIEWYKHKKRQLVGPHTWDMAFCFSRHNHQAFMEYCEQNYQSARR